MLLHPISMHSRLYFIYGVSIIDLEKIQEKIQKNYKACSIGTRLWNERNFSRDGFHLTAYSIDYLRGKATKEFIVIILNK